MVKIEKVARALDLCAGGVMIAGGIFYCGISSFQHFVMGFVTIIIGLFNLAAASRNKMAKFYVMKWGPFIRTMLGRAFFYIYVGCTLAFGGWWSRACSVIVIVLGFIAFFIWLGQKYMGLPSSFETDAFQMQSSDPASKEPSPPPQKPRPAKTSTERPVESKTDDNDNFV